MTKSTTRKAAAPKKESAAKAPEPMDPGTREQAVGTQHQNNRRDCWAIKTLVAEFHELFPETPYETSNLDGRNTALDVTFDISTLDVEDRRMAVSLLVLTQSDQRVSEVITQEDFVLVSFWSSLRTQDLRDPFRLADAWDILAGHEGGIL